MQKAICKVLVLPIRKSQESGAEMISQMLFGETCTIVSVKGFDAKIVTDFDHTEGWVFIHNLENVEGIASKNIVQKPFEFKDFQGNNALYSIGSEVDFEIDQVVDQANLRESLVKWAFTFRHVPFLAGGRSFFGLDSSAFIQLLFKAHGIVLPRTAVQQSNFGQVLDFVEESEGGDLAFFEDETGLINHVGLMMNNCEVMHCFGEVRKDAIDSLGIFNIELNRHTHKLRFIKRIL